MDFCRELVQPETVAAVRDHNATQGARKRLRGGADKQSTTGAAFAGILSKREAQVLMENSKFKKVAAGITNQHLQQIGEKVNARVVLGIMDKRGVPESAYNAMFKTVNTAVHEVDNNLRFKALPKPHHVSYLEYSTSPQFVSSPTAYLLQLCNAPYHFCPLAGFRPKPD